MAGKWISKAIRRPGALTKKARTAGQTVRSYCRTRMSGSGRTARQCRLARTLRSLPRRR